MRMISSTLIILRDPVRPVHKLGEPLESAIVPCCFGFFPLLKGRQLQIFPITNTSPSPASSKHNVCSDSTFFRSQCVKQTYADRPSSLPVCFLRKQGHARPTSVVVRVEDHRQKLISANGLDGLWAQEKYCRLNIGKPSIKVLEIAFNLSASFHFRES